MQTEKSESVFSVSDLLWKAGLYKKIDISMHQPFIIDISLLGMSLDLYCPGCNNMSIFKRVPEENEKIKLFGNQRPQLPTFIDSVVPKKSFIHQNRDITFELGCSRNLSHRIKYFLRIEDDTMMKIGQYPSLADLQLHNLDEYKGVLNETQLKEFARAISLNAHGIGIGAFVYLRRIFENLIEAAHETAARDTDWIEEHYQKGRTEDRIKLLRNHLPALLVANAGIYGILSKGIHSLSEKECLEYFDTLKVGIELILDEKIETERKEQHKKHLTGEITRIQAKIK